MASGHDSKLAIANRRIFRTARASWAVDQGAVVAALPRMTTPFFQRDYQFTTVKRSGQKLPAPRDDFVRKDRQHESDKYNQHMYEFDWSYSKEERYINQNPVEANAELAELLLELSELPSQVVLIGTNGDHAGTGAATDNLSENTVYGIADIPHATHASCLGTRERPQHCSPAGALGSAGDYSTQANLLTDLTQMAISLNMAHFYGPRGLIMPRPMEPVLWSLFSALWKTSKDWLADIGNMLFIPQAITGEPTTVAGTFYEWMIDLMGFEIWGADGIQETWRNPDNKNTTIDVRQTMFTKFNPNYVYNSTAGAWEWVKGMVTINADYKD
ncbi:MAG: hypothetical protein JW839_02160 [Candidatus Lokiarchaeota archaeon]|nr:hypothetical protein [Candidatus Lokiarchaeota archaeon]